MLWSDSSVHIMSTKFMFQQIIVNLIIVLVGYLQYNTCYLLNF